MVAHHVIGNDCLKAPNSLPLLISGLKLCTGHLLLSRDIEKHTRAPSRCGLCNVHLDTTLWQIRVFYYHISIKILQSFS